MPNKLRTAHADERGVTLVELIFTLMIFSIVGAVFTSVLYAVQTNVARQQVRTVANDQARLAIEQMDREIRSGSVLYDPSVEPAGDCGGHACAPNFSLRVYTQANATTRTPPNQCVQWVVDDGNLYRRAWAAGSPTSLDGWRTVAEHVVNRDPSVGVPAFAMDPTPGSKVLGIVLLVNPNLGSTDAPRNLRIETSIAVRNKGAGDPCTPAPST